MISAFLFVVTSLLAAFSTSDGGVMTVDFAVAIAVTVVSLIVFVEISSEGVEPASLFRTTIKFC